MITTESIISEIYKEEINYLKVIGMLVRHEKEKVSLKSTELKGFEKIILSVFNVSKVDLFSSSRKTEITWARDLCFMYRLNILKEPPTEITEYYNLHRTMYYTIPRRHSDLVQTKDTRYMRYYDEILDLLNRESI